MFWQNFLELCDSVGLAPNAVAKKIGISSGSITNWSKDNTIVPQRRTLKKIAEFFHVSIDYLLRESDPPLTNIELAKDELNLLKAWRLAVKANDFEVMDNTAWALRKYGMPMPEKNNTDQQSNSVIK